MITKTACAAAVLDGRTTVKEEDLLKSSHLALSHRTREGGLEPPPTQEEIENAFEESSRKWGQMWKEKGGAQVSAPMGNGMAESGGDTDVKKNS